MPDPKGRWVYAPVMRAVVIAFVTLCVAPPAACQDEVEKVATQIGATLDALGWKKAPATAPGAVATWEDRSDKRVLRVTLSSFDAGTVSLFDRMRDMVEVLDERQDFKSKLVSDSETVVRFKLGAESIGKKASYHWLRRIELGSGSAITLFATTSLSADADERKPILPLRRRGFDPALTAFLSATLLRECTWTKKDSILKFGSGHKLQTFRSPKGWRKADNTTGFATWQPKKGDGRITLSAHVPGRDQSVGEFLQERIAAIATKDVKPLKKLTVKKGIADVTFAVADAKAKTAAWHRLQARRWGKLFLLATASTSKRASRFESATKSFLSKWKSAKPK